MKSADPVDAFADELSEALRTVKRDVPSALLDGELARDAVILCEKQTESLAKGRLVNVALSYLSRSCFKTASEKGRSRPWSC